jgi:hypothetical protein
MSKVVEIVRDALGHLRVGDADAAPDPIDLRDGIRALNLMMRAWEAQNLPLGWYDVTGPDEDMPTDPSFDEAIGANLALKLRARYGATLDADVIQMAEEGRALISATCAAADYARLSYPDLPCSEGHSGVGGYPEGLSGR